MGLKNKVGSSLCISNPLYHGAHPFTWSTFQHGVFLEHRFSYHTKRDLSNVAQSIIIYTELKLNLCEEQEQVNIKGKAIKNH